MSNEIIHLTRNQLHEIISLTLNDLLKQNMEQIINSNLNKVNSVCTTSLDIPINYKSSISIIGSSGFTKPSPNSKYNNTGINILDYLKLIPRDHYLLQHPIQLSIIKIAKFISNIVTISSKFIVLRYELNEGIKLLFEFMKMFNTPNKYVIIFKMYKHEKDGCQYSHNGHTVAFVKDDAYYFMDIDNSIISKIEVSNLNSISFNTLYPDFKYVDIIYTLREKFDEGRPCEPFHMKPNVVTEYVEENKFNPPQNTHFVFQAPQPTANTMFQVQQQPATNTLFQAPQQPATNTLFQAPQQPAANTLFQAPQQPAANTMFQAPQQPAANTMFQSPQQPAANTLFQAPNNNLFGNSQFKPFQFGAKK